MQAHNNNSFKTKFFTITTNIFHHYIDAIIVLFLGVYFGYTLNYQITRMSEDYRQQMRDINRYGNIEIQNTLKSISLPACPDYILQELNERVVQSFNLATKLKEKKMNNVLSSEEKKLYFSVDAQIEQAKSEYDECFNRPQRDHENRLKNRLYCLVNDLNLFQNRVSLSSSSKDFHLIKHLEALFQNEDNNYQQIWNEIVDRANKNIRVRCFDSIHSEYQYNSVSNNKYYSYVAKFLSNQAILQESRASFDINPFMYTENHFGNTTDSTDVALM